MPKPPSPSWRTIENRPPSVSTEAASGFTTASCHGTMGPMPRVHVEAAGSSSEELLELGDRQSAILGRNPDPKTVDAQLDLAGARAVRVQSPSVSANHVA